MGKPHPFIPNSSHGVRKEMLREIGVGDVQRFFDDIPETIKKNSILQLSAGKSEMEARLEVENLLSRNLSTKDVISFLGGGVWPHYVPAAVDEIVLRSEFITSYTPYQPEISQGMLQALFEYQSMIAELMAMEYANSSLYDWATALGEAARMACRVTGRDEFLVPHYIQPDRLRTLKTFCEPAGMKIVELRQSRETGAILEDDLHQNISSRVAGVYIENPSYLGFFEADSKRIGEIAHEKGALFIVGADPISLGLFAPPGELGADIAIGEGQPLGNHMNYGGPLLGLFACRGDRLLRHMPGRLIGMTVTKDGSSKAFTMTLQTREQHIRREKATSNICTNEALCAVAAAVYLSLMGSRGLEELGKTILANSSYAMRRLKELGRIKVPLFEAQHFKEFAVGFNDTGIRASEVNAKLQKRGIQGGACLDTQFPELGQSALYCVTELHTRENIDQLVAAIRAILEE
ncbi:aminomethyl-transferring glycine dehydrogenase subunit GcvPA [[Eubacterium] cellulosolvens]